MDRKQPAHRSRELIEICSLAARVEGACRWCGAELPKRRRTWCSDRCADRFWKNHWWTLARRAVKRRDNYRCTRCGHKPPARSDPRYKRLRATDRLEVNHIEPARGAHRALSCLHHLDNLEALCLACHRAVTGEQRALLV
jgi:5-methylcytosine-specific restriction endonuclease McrA